MNNSVAILSNDIESIEPLPGPIRAKLSIPLISSYLARNISVRKIAEHLGYSHTWLQMYIKKHHEAFTPLLDKDDTVLKMKFKHIVNLCQDKLIEHLPNVEQKDIHKLGLIEGINFDKYRLANDQSTTNVSTKHTINEDRSAIEKELNDVQAKIAALKGEVIDV